MAYVFPRPAQYSGKVAKKEYLNNKTIKLDIVSEKPEKFFFFPGQFINLKVNQFIYRPYSIASYIDRLPIISIILTVAHEGLGSNYVKSLNIGDPVSFIGPSGRFVLPDELYKYLLFLVTGTGLAPILPMLQQLTELKTNSEIELYVGFRNEDDIFEESFLKSCESKLKNFKYHICISQPSQIWAGFQGRITGFYKIIDIENTQCFICGNPEMVTEVIERLKLMGINKTRIFHEKFVLFGK